MCRTNPFIEHLAYIKTYNRHKKGKEVWRKCIDLFPPKIKLKRYPNTDTSNHREKRRDGMHPFMYYCSNKGNKCSGKSYFICIFDHSKNLSLLLIILIYDKTNNNEKETNNRSSREKERLSIR